ncbi:large proline-rich protein bag6 [Orussus abietinus]|uniref:large proline-rich protein bag6 n=1 Tax=Orussus abietinus TaxID=222816 RepID=UPI000625057D|nr:large proline-rich protein bag6 [Orussus abietinus]XP_012282088.1 large proline-rich protein bag6 [Orussus abietinus]
MIDLTVKTLDSQDHTFSLEDDITVRGFKEHIAESVSVPADLQRLIYCGRVLQDEKKLNDYDVNGKVIHLVQRAPPPPGQRGNSGGQGQGQNQDQSWQSSQRRQFTESHGQVHGNAMYLGAMSVPTEVVEGQGLPVPPLSNTLSNGRLIVAKRMLNRSIECIYNHRHPRGATSSTEPYEVPLSLEVNIQEESEPVLDNTNEIGREAASRPSFEQVVTASIAAALGLSNVSFMRGGTEEGNQSSTSTASADNTATETQQQSDQQEQPTAAPSSESQSTRTDAPVQHTRAMARLVDRLIDAQNRLRPYLHKYRHMMASDPELTPGASEQAEENQRIVNCVSESLHYLAHGCHALSDIIVDMRQPPPRNLRCRPILIQHSAVLQAGIPIQVEAHISLQGRNSNNNTGSDEASRRTNDQATAGRNESTESTTTEGRGRAQQDATSQNPQNEENQRPEQEQSARQQTRPPFSTVFNLPSYQLQNNVEVLMEVSPEMSSMESTAQGEQTQGTGNNNNNNAGGIGGASGIFPRGSAPPADFIRNLNHAIEVAARALMSENSTSGIGTQQTTLVTIDGAGLNPGQSTQARSNVDTHPTTATQTRSSSRPHVFEPHSHLGIGVVMGQGIEFDPLLPCNSHHIRRTPATTSSTIGTTQSQSQPNQTAPPRAHGWSALEVLPSISSTSSSSLNSSTPTSTASSSPSKSQTKPPPPPPEVKMWTEAEPVEEGEETPPSTFLGHDVVPSDWMPVIARDGVRQRRQLENMGNNDATAFNDAYLSGLPNKKPSPSATSSTPEEEASTACDATSAKKTSSEDAATPDPTSSQSQPKPMETDAVETKLTCETEPMENGEEIPTTFPGHENLPSDWVPIIARDSVKQRRHLQCVGCEDAAPPFSDAYLGCMPSKRRKLIEQQKPRLLMSPTPSHSLSAISASMERLVREGTNRAGVHEVEGAAVAVATTPAVRRAFGRAIRDCLHPRTYRTPDFPDPRRFPNATKYFADQERRGD